MKHSERQLTTLLSCLPYVRAIRYFQSHFEFHAKLIALIACFDASLEARVKRNASEEERSEKNLSVGETCEENVARRSEETFPLMLAIFKTALRMKIASASFLVCHGNGRRDPLEAAWKFK